MARIKRRTTKDGLIGFRCTKKVKEAWEDYCVEADINPAEFFRTKMDEEMKRYKGPAQ